MKIQCPGCKKNINIKKGTYPEEKKFSFLCPGCGTKIQVNPMEIKRAEENNDIPDKNLSGDELKKEILNTNPSLPPIPDILLRAKELIESSGYSAKELSRIISLDQAIAARVLKLANSAYFNFNPPIPTIEEACILLGEKNLMSIIMVAQMSKMLDKELKGYNISKGNLFYHSIASAVAADIIAEEKMPLFELDAFSAGLLHDCGKMILNEYVNQRKQEFVHLISDAKMPCYLAEKKMFGFSHAEIGYDFLKSWHLPEIQTHAIGFHHNPHESGMNELSYILNAADFFAKKAGFSAADYCMENSLLLENEVKEFLNIEDYEIDEFTNKIRKNVLEMTKDFSF
ncbi:MAG: HDOD domain-containing protein [Desulforegulaceae bacterium]|jgi:putative nucleotidyltransferase with HDIG domain|nr:HDOD domain-containing protein [Desulforegulaceae bacterium]